MSFKFGTRISPGFGWDFSSRVLVPSSAASGVPFISTWNTEEAGTSNNVQISLPLLNGGSYDFVVDWGDSNQDTITAWDDAAKTHTYASSGNYNVTITGVIEGWQFNNGGDRLKLSNIEGWGTLKLTTVGAFYGCENMTCNAVDALDVSGTTQLNYTFRSCKVLNGGLANLDVAHVVSLYTMFYGATLFNEDIGGWDTANTVNMNMVFRDAEAFNQNIGSWNTATVISMYYMFRGATVFNQNIGSWNTANVTDMNTMFGLASAFNQDIGNWNTSKLTDPRTMFFLATSFDQDIGDWDVTKFDYANSMFASAGLSTPNYNALLVGWSAQAVKSGVNFDAGSSRYSAGAPATARASLVSDGWTITDGGPA